MPNLHITSGGYCSRMYANADINKTKMAVWPVQTNISFNLFLTQFIKWCIILWSTSSMLQFKISFSATMFLMLVRLVSLYLTTTCC